MTMLQDHEFDPVSPEEEQPGRKGGPEDGDEDEDDELPRGSRIDFGQLQFGRDYEIK